MSNSDTPAKVGSMEGLGLEPERLSLTPDQMRALLAQLADELKDARALADSEGTRAVKYLRRARKAEAALRELVACKDLKERVEAADMSSYSIADADAAQTMADEYARRKGPAWQAARDALGPNV